MKAWCIVSGISKSILSVVCLSRKYGEGFFILDAKIPKFTDIKFEKADFYLGNRGPQHV